MLTYVESSQFEVMQDIFAVFPLAIVHPDFKIAPLRGHEQGRVILSLERTVSNSRCQL